MAVTDLQTEAVELLQQLIRFNTVNPPGNERPAIEHLDRYLRQAGFDTEILAADPARPNLVATLPGDGDGPFSACSVTSTRSSPTPRSGVMTRGPARSPTATCGAGARWT